jgi:hypothetical protein
LLFDLVGGEAESVKPAAGGEAVRADLGDVDLAGRSVSVSVPCAGFRHDEPRSKVNHESPAVVRSPLAYTERRQQLRFAVDGREQVNVANVATGFPFVHREPGLLFSDVGPDFVAFKMIESQAAKLVI